MKQLEKRVGAFPAMMMQGAPPAKQAAVRMMTPKILSTVLNRSGAFFVEAFEPNQGGFELDAAMILNFGEDATPVASAITLLIQSEDVKLEPVEMDGSTFQSLVGCRPSDQR